MSKERLDILLVKKGLVSTRERARSSIMAGVVYVSDQKEDKPGTKFDEGLLIEVREEINPFVSRGGLKLSKALSYFEVDITGKETMDVGASTGGFTDCMLKAGATKVIAVDVGYGQLVWSLRSDPRVHVMERTNIRYVKPLDLPYIADFATIDVAFISIKKVLPVLMQLLKETAEIIALIKPQFEAGRDKVKKHGVVRDPQVHSDVIHDITRFSQEQGLGVMGLTFSPIKGPEGNIEYLVYLKRGMEKMDDAKLDELVESIVKDAHALLKD